MYFEDSTENMGCQLDAIDHSAQDINSDRVPFHSHFWVRNLSSLNALQNSFEERRQGASPCNGFWDPSK